MGNCSRFWLKQDLCLAEADGETEEAGGFCKLFNDDLEVRLPLRHEGTVVSKQCFQDSLFIFFTVFVLAVIRRRLNRKPSSLIS